MYIQYIGYTFLWCIICDGFVVYGFENTYVQGCYTAPLSLSPSHHLVLVRDEGSTWLSGLVEVETSLG